MSSSLSGIGIDILELQRFEDIVSSRGETFLKRVFMSRELDYSESQSKPIVTLAGILAAKEAVVKAGNAIASFNVFQVEIRPDSAYSAKAIVEEAFISNAEFLVSFAFSRSFVVAVAICHTNNLC